MNRPSFLPGSVRAVVLLAVTGVTAVRVDSANLVASQAIVVSTSAELEAALTPANAGREIVVRAGVYDVSRPLVVPDHVSLSGEGVMEFDAQGRPAGLGHVGRTVIRSTLEVAGDVLTLENGASLRRLVIEDISGRSIAGSVVVIASRHPGDVISAAIVECEIINPNPFGILPHGPTGRGVVVVSRNPNLGAEPPPHEGARVALQMTHSIVRAPRSGHGLFAINFAGQSTIEIFLADNVIGGGIDTVGGVSRPNTVESSTVAVDSHRNLYRSDSLLPGPNGWTLHGGTDAPFPGLVSEGANRNVMRFHSADDHVTGFRTAVLASAGRRASAVSGSSSGNLLELQMSRTRLSSLVADLEFFGSRSEIIGVTPGGNNHLRAVVREVLGSGHRENRYQHSAVPAGQQPGIGNTLDVVGNLWAFGRSNIGIDPPPGDAFFTGR